MQDFKAWMAETILTGKSRARLWWYDDHPPQTRIFKHGNQGVRTEMKTVELTLVRCTPTPFQQTITLSMSQRELQAGLIMPNAVALIREGLTGEIWRGEPRFLAKPRDKVVLLFFTIEGDYD